MKNKHLTAADRGAIEVLLQENYTLTDIAKKIGFNKSTVSREIRNNSVSTGYIANFAQVKYQSRRRKCKKKIKINQSKVQKYINQKLQLGWSPQQISGRMKLKKSICVCPETIYQWLYEDPWAKQEKLYQYLRYGRKKRKKQKHRQVQKSKIPNRTSIDQRPRVVDKRKEFGHFEGDSVIYPNKYAINTVNELMTGLARFSKLKRKTAKLTAQAMTNKLNQFQEDKQNKQIKIRTLTLDNGSEFSDHEVVMQNTGVQTYFADAYASWQRGANENLNMLLRGYLPKRCDISQLTQEELDNIAEELNNRPRKRLGYLTPNEVFNFYKEYGKLPSVAVGARI